MDLLSPTSKMSKSDDAGNGRILLMEKPEDIMRKFKRAVTDSDTGRCVYYDAEKKPGVANLMQIYAACTGKSFEAIEAEFEGKGYGVFKPAGRGGGGAAASHSGEAERILKDKAYLENIYKTGAERAGRVAERTLRKVYKKVGLVQR
jgi:tryptophanyl-tRNA synthetase